MNRLQLRRFGQLDLYGSPIGLGTVKWGRNQKVKYAPFELPSIAQLQSLLGAAEELGINVIDTAPAYGIAEERAGAALKGHRDRFLLISKVGEEFEEGVSRYHFDPSHVIASVERSLVRLGTDRLDLLLLHCPPVDLPIVESHELHAVLQSLKNRGLVRYVGASTMTLEGGLRAVELLDAVMVSWNIDYRAQQAVIDRAHERGRAVLLKKALLSGDLGGHGRPSRVQECIQGALSVQGVSSLIVGTIQEAHLRENVAAALPRSGMEGC